MGAHASTAPQTNADNRSVYQRFQVHKDKLGEGAFADIWKALHRETGQTVALKQLDKAKMAKNQVKRADIERQIHMMKTCTHDNILRLFTTFEEGQSIFLALEYCGNGDLAEKLQARGASLCEQEVATWMRHMCSAIQELHSKGICHRDIKPKSFMVSGGLLKLIDFSLASFAPSGELLKKKCGTPAFMAPEQHRLPDNSLGYGLPVDLWAAGISLYMFMAGGRHPFMQSKDHPLEMTGIMKGTLPFDSKIQGPKKVSFAKPESEQHLVEQVSDFFGFTFEKETDTRFAPAARELCQLMVQVNASQRITAETALRHPWLAGASERIISADPPPTAKEAQEAFSDIASRGDAASPRVLPETPMLAGFPGLSFQQETTEAREPDAEASGYTNLSQNLTSQPQVPVQRFVARAAENVELPQHSLGFIEKETTDPDEDMAYVEWLSRLEEQRAVILELQDQVKDLEAEPCAKRWHDYYCM